MPRRPSYDRDDLINRARDLFWKQGWAGTSLKDLEEALDMKPGSFYAAFGSKDALFALALETYSKDGLARLRALAEAYGPFVALKRFPNLLVTSEDAPTKACMLAKTLLELQAKGHPLAIEADRLLRKMGVLFEELFEKAQAQGDIAQHHDTRQLAQRYQSDILGLRFSAERADVDGSELAENIAADLTRLA